MVNVSKAKLRTVKIPVPSPELQQVYVERVERIASLQEAVESDVASLDELFASLQQRAFRGDLFSSPLPDELADAVA